MPSYAEKLRLLLFRTLETVARQQEAFHIQTSLLIEGILCSEFPRELETENQLKLHNIFISSCKISKVIEEMKAQVSNLNDKSLKNETLKSVQRDSLAKNQNRDPNFGSNIQEKRHNFRPEKPEEKKFEVESENSIEKEGSIFMKKNYFCDELNVQLGEWLKINHQPEVSELLPLLTKYFSSEEFGLSVQNDDLRARAARSSRNKKIKNSSKRGPYMIISKQLKNDAVKVAQELSIKEASNVFGINEKNIKRWILNGTERKKGAGRKKREPLMEAKLLCWIVTRFKEGNRLPNHHEVKEKAKELSELDCFKASKGWCDKFLKRNSKFFLEIERDLA